MRKDILSIAVHDGGFHADDVFACATLSLYFEKKNQEVHFVRTHQMDGINRADIVVDIGRRYDPLEMRFDHHQNSCNEMRENGILYASFGLVWRHFGEELCGSKEVQNSIDRELTQQIDADDTGINITKSLIPGVEQYTIPKLISEFNIQWDEEGEQDDAFYGAVLLAKIILQRKIYREKSLQDARIEIFRELDKLDDKRIVALDKKYPKYVLERLPGETLFTINPGRNNTWAVRAVRKDGDTFDSKLAFPESWAGMEGKDLQEITGVRDAIFCHKTRFLAIAESKEGALELARLVVNKEH